MYRSAMSKDGVRKRLHGFSPLLDRTPEDMVHGDQIIELIENRLSNYKFLLVDFVHVNSSESHREINSDSNSMGLTKKTLA
jgi:hypothetical protein